MKKLLLILVPGLLAFGCGTVTQTMNFAPGASAVVTLSPQDIVIGGVVTATINYDDTDVRIREKVMAKALEKTDYDFVLMPKFKLEIMAAGAPRITVTGRGAKIK